MIRVYIQRETITDQGTPGILSAPALGFSCFSLELPWKDNQVGVSCIPAGEYTCERYFSRTFRQHLYRVCEVPGRSGIALHSGNVAGDKSQGYKTHSLGCILLGRRRGELWDQEAVLASRLAIGEFFRELDRKPFNLQIKGDQDGYN